VISEIVVEDISHPAQPDVITSQQIVVHLAAVGSGKPPHRSYEAEVKRADQQLYQRRYPFPGEAVELTIPVRRAACCTTCGCARSVARRTGGRRRAIGRRSSRSRCRCRG
jgi:hypothetical protein